MAQNEYTSSYKIFYTALYKLYKKLIILFHKNDLLLWNEQFKMFINNNCLFIEQMLGK